MSEGEGFLHLTLRDTKNNNSLILEDKVYITLKNLREMYTVANFRAVPDTGPPPSEPFDFDRTKLTKQEVTVFVHGFNVDAGEPTLQSFDTVFRRLYWTGVTNPRGPSDFIGLTWTGDEGISAQYNKNVFNAFQVSIPVGNFFKSLKSSGRRVNVLAHSLGNMVVSSAIKNVKDN